MVGYVIAKEGGTPYEFHVGEQDLRRRLNEANQNSRVMTLQLDCDELEVVLRALEGPAG